jgi:hypothetical protein
MNKHLLFLTGLLLASAIPRVNGQKQKGQPPVADAGSPASSPVSAPAGDSMIQTSTIATTSAEDITTTSAAGPLLQTIATTSAQDVTTASAGVPIVQNIAITSISAPVTNQNSVTANPVTKSLVTASPVTPAVPPASSPVVESPAASPVNNLPVTCSDNDAFPFYVDATYGKQTCAWLRKVGTGVAFDALCSSKAPLGYGFVVCPETCGRC